MNGTILELSVNKKLQLIRLVVNLNGTRFGLSVKKKVFICNQAWIRSFRIPLRRNFSFYDDDPEIATCEIVSFGFGLDMQTKSFVSQEISSIC